MATSFHVPTNRFLASPCDASVAGRRCSAWRRAAWGHAATASTRSEPERITTLRIEPPSVRRRGFCREGDELRRRCSARLHFTPPGPILKINLCPELQQPPSEDGGRPSPLRPERVVSRQYGVRVEDVVGIEVRLHTTSAHPEDPCQPDIHLIEPLLEET